MLKLQLLQSVLARSALLSLRRRVCWRLVGYVFNHCGLSVCGPNVTEKIESEFFRFVFSLEMRSVIWSLLVCELKKRKRSVCKYVCMVLHFACMLYSDKGWLEKRYSITRKMTEQFCGQSQRFIPTIIINGKQGTSERHNPIPLNRH